MNVIFSNAIKDILRSAGWTEGRRVDPTVGLPEPAAIFPAAMEVLAEFRGLHVGSRGLGINRARSDVKFDPTRTIYLLPELKTHEVAVGRKLFPIAEIHAGHGYLIIDEDGRTYLLADDLVPLAATFAEALEMLLLGLRPPNWPL